MPYHTMDSMTRAGCTSRRGVRHWEDEGLLGPVERSNGGTRRYTDVQLDRAKIIAAAQFGGFNLEQIAGMLAAYDVDPEVYEALCVRLSDQMRAAIRLVENLPKPKHLHDAKEYDL